MAETAVFGMVISSGPNVAMLVPFADAAVKLAGPKLVSGSVRLPLDGAPAMTSAEDSAAPFSVALAGCVQPLGRSFRTSWNVPPPWAVTEPENWSPGLTCLGRFTD